MKLGDFIEQGRKKAICRNIGAEGAVLLKNNNNTLPLKKGTTVAAFGRTQRIFIAKLIKYNGYDFNFLNINPDLLMIVTIKAANGVTDDLYKIFSMEIK